MAAVIQWVILSTRRPSFHLPARRTAMDLDDDPAQVAIHPGPLLLVSRLDHLSRVTVHHGAAARTM